MVAQLTYLIPSWLILFLMAQVIAFWQLIISFGIL
jgi:hypothetical protein